MVVPLKTGEHSPRTGGHRPKKRSLTSGVPVGYFFNLAGVPQTHLTGVLHGVGARGTMVGVDHNFDESVVEIVACVRRSPSRYVYLSPPGYWVVPPGLCRLGLGCAARDVPLGLCRLICVARVVSPVDE